MNIVVSRDADSYFKLHNITSREWSHYCWNQYNLQTGDIVYYEGNLIGYIKQY